jgi:hypothetical protein
MPPRRRTRPARPRSPPPAHRSLATWLPPHQARVAGRISRHDHQQSAALVRKSPHPPPKALLDGSEERCRAREPRPARQLRRGQSSGQLQHRQRVPPGSRRRSGSGPARPVARSAPSPAAPAHRPPASPRSRAPATPPHGRTAGAPRDQAHRFCFQAARREPERLRGGVIEPLLVIDQADQRLLLGCVGQQAQHGQADQEPVRSGPGAKAERGL